MILNYKYRLYPTKKQEQQLQNQFFVATQSWNYALNLRIKDLKHKNGFTPIKLIEKYIKTKLNIRNIPYHSGILQMSVKNLDNTLKTYFKNKEDFDFPRFKKSHKIQQSFEFKNQGIQIKDKYFQILKMKIKWKYHRELPNFPKKIIIKRESDGNYYAIFSVEKMSNPLEKTNINAGIDLNVKNIAVATSLGDSYLKIIRKMNKYDKKYQKIQKKLSDRYHKKSKSKNTKKLQKKQNKIHKKVKNIKEDFFHKTSLELIKNFDRITIEKLDIKKMIEGDIRHLRKSISDVSWNSLIEKLKYKAEMYDKVLIQINPAYTSQRCNHCGYISRKNRTTQIKFLCKECSHSDNADINAAKNILEYENWSLEQMTRWDTRHIESLVA